MKDAKFNLSVIMITATSIVAGILVLIKRNKELLTTEEEIALNNTISKYKQAIDPTSNSSLNNFGNFLLNELSCHKFKKIAPGMIELFNTYQNDIIKVDLFSSKIFN